MLWCLNTLSTDFSIQQVLFYLCFRFSDVFCQLRCVTIIGYTRGGRAVWKQSTSVLWSRCCLKFLTLTQL